MMNFEKIKGLIVAPFTPFDKKGEVDLSPIGDYATMLQKNGIIGVFINGSSGEGYMMTVEERMKLAEKWISVVDLSLIHICCMERSICISRKKYFNRKRLLSFNADFCRKFVARRT